MIHHHADDDADDADMEAKRFPRFAFDNTSKRLYALMRITITAAAGAVQCSGREGKGYVHTLCVVSRSKMSETRKRNTKAEREKEGEEGEIGSLSPHLADEMRIAPQLRPVCTSVSGLKRNVRKKNVLRDRKTRGEREEKKVDERISD